METIPSPVCSQVMLFATPFFYAHPIKLILGCLCASSYEIAFEQGFRPDHMKPYNLGLHVICLFLQLGGNFSWLACLDELLWTKKAGGSSGTRWISMVTAFLWSILLVLASDSPPAVRILSVVAILFSYLYAPRLFTPRWIEMAGAATVIHALAIETILLKRPPFGAVFFTILVLLLLVWKTLSGYPSKNGPILTGNVYIVALFGVLVAASSKEDPVKGSVAIGTFFSWMLGMVSETPWLVFLSFGFMAMSAQGVAHELSGELATIFRITGDESIDDVLASEWGHSLYFPSLLFHSVHNSILGK